MVSFYRPSSADRHPDARTTTRPDGTPAPTGYFPDRRGPAQAPVVRTPVYDQLYGPGRQEVLDGAELVDQHPYTQVSATWTPPPAGPRRDGREDPLTDGPAAPTPRLLGLFYARAQGTSATGLMDAPGIRYPTVGSQDGASYAYFQDPVRALAPYAPPAGADQMPDTLRALPPSPPHGWTEQPVMVAQQVERDKMTALRGQQAGHQDRLANATYAGQSYSARTAHLGAPGTGASGTTPSWRTRG